MWAGIPGLRKINLKPQHKLLLKGQCHEIFDFRFSIHGSVSHRPLNIPLGPFQIFRKFAKIFTAQGVENGKKSPIRKVLISSFEPLWVVELAYM
jgi:hypothetical protein